MLRPIGDGIWVLEHPLRMAGGIEIGTRSTWIRLADGSLLLHSPGPMTEEQLDRVRALAPVSAIVAPNAFHHLFVERAAQCFPAAELHAVGSLHEKLPGLSMQLLGGEAASAWHGILEHEGVGGMPRLDEVVCFHPASRTLLLVDLCFNMRRFDNRRTGWFMRLVGAHGCFGPSRLARSMIKDRAALRASVDRMLAWDFDRVVVTHGDLVETGGREAFRESFAFLQA